MSAVSVTPGGPAFNSDVLVEEGSYPLERDPREDPGVGEGPVPSGGGDFVADPSFFGWLRGAWTLDLAGSPLPPMAGLELPEKSTLTFDKDGGFKVSLPKMVIRHSLGVFVAAIEGEGAARISGPQDADGRVPMSIDMRFTKRDFSQSTWSLPFNVTFIANAIFDLVTKRSPPTVLLSVSSQHGEDALLMLSGAYGHRVVRPSISCRVAEVSFLNSHDKLQDVSGKDARYWKQGANIEPPHWTSGGRKMPVSYTRGATIHLEAVVTVMRPGERFRLFGINKTSPWLNFESDPVVATGLPQTLTFHGKAPMPMKLGDHHVDILWNVQFIDDDLWYYAGLSSHHLYATHAEPIPLNSSGKHNDMTCMRMDFISTILDRIASPAPTVGEVAIEIQRGVNGYTNPVAATLPLRTPIRAHPASTLNLDGESDNPNAVWGLLDTDNTKFGNCGEATMLMELMLRMLGWEATQTHVYASTKIEVLKAGLNVNAIRDGKPFGDGAQKRRCPNPQHPAEELSMAFLRHGDGLDLRINVGEGCVEVEGQLYAGLEDAQAIEEKGRKAPHNMLLKLRDDTAHNIPEKALNCRFQIWTYRVSGGFQACECGPPDWSSAVKPFGEDVPG
jgi:hypothetical protein